MLALHPRLVAADDADDAEGRACYCVVVAYVSLLLFIVLAVVVSVARAGAITGAVVLLLLLVGWLAPTGTERRGARQQAPAAATPVAARLVHHRCACGLSDAAIGALPTFAYQPPAATKGADGVLCAVCLGDVQAGEMVRQLLPACSHLFHADCVDAWLRAHRTCPLCRRELPSRNDVADKASSSSPSDVLPPV